MKGNVPLNPLLTNRQINQSQPCQTVTFFINLKHLKINEALKNGLLG